MLENDDSEIMDRLAEIERILREVQSRIPDLEGLAKELTREFGYWKQHA